MKRGDEKRKRKKKQPRRWEKSKKKTVCPEKGKKWKE